MIRLHKFKSFVKKLATKAIHEHDRLAGVCEHISVECVGKILYQEKNVFLSQSESIFCTERLLSSTYFRYVKEKISWINYFSSKVANDSEELKSDVK